MDNLNQSERYVARYYGSIGVIVGIGVGTVLTAALTILLLELTRAAN